MKQKTEIASLVIAGSFNFAIFNDVEWVRRFLIPKEEFKLEFPVDIFASTRYSSSDFRFGLINNTLQFWLLRNDNNALGKIEELANKLLTTYPILPLLH